MMPRRWATPASPYFTVSLIGPKWGMIAGTLFIAIFLKPFYGTLYAGSVLVGVGAAVLWTAQGMFLTVNSDKQTMARNSGLFWALFQSSYVIGNLFFFLYLRGQEDITDGSRMVIYYGFAVDVGCWGWDHAIFQVSCGGVISPKSRYFRCAMAMNHRLHQTFFSGVYGTSLGYTTDFGIIRKSILGLAGVAIGVGQITERFGVWDSRQEDHSLWPGSDRLIRIPHPSHRVLFNILEHSRDAPLRESTLQRYMTPNIYLGIFCCFLLGLGDASFNTQVYSLLGRIYRTNSASAFALFKFVQSVCAALAFAYSSLLVLEFQLLILVVAGLLGTFCFSFVEWRHAADGVETKEV
ncbi:putative UNC93-like protein MFSD11 [Hypsibius exemplaris]|uniref:UNC93-like protein MFSD11 n=1 Tax=Hypsibius exemplaris TaxID=2072580 RepID=A0A1W0WY08_HYPEX|nr:putative UNC93-like protein MFSD11 [Hypsibius exemplaris]